jgi:hypothetical protein
MVRLFIPEPLTSEPLAPWFGELPRSLTYTENLPSNFFETDVIRTAQAADAQAIVLPNNFKKTLSPEATRYVQTYVDTGEEAGKPVYVFSLGDFTGQIQFDPRVFVFRYSLYTDTTSSQDISMPTLTADVAPEGITIRQKQERPRVSFCGLAGFPTLKRRLAYVIKNLILTFQSFANPHTQARKLGIYWRRAAMRACEASLSIDTHFIIRKTFSGNRATIEIDPAQARKEYLDSIRDADFVLAPKGDGNYSNRFLETLSMGRIPVLIDTNVILPLEDRIDYSKIIVRVPMNRVKETPIYIRNFYEALSEEEWRKRQQLARDTFARYLRVDSFFKSFFASV